MADGCVASGWRVRVHMARRMLDSLSHRSAPLSQETHHERLSEAARVELLRNSGLLDGASAPVLDRLARIASVLLGVPISAVTLVDDLGQHFPGLCGIEGWAAERRGTPMSYSFCQHVVTSDEPLIVSDARMDPLVCDNLATIDLNVVAYAGVPLRTGEGHTLGAFCAIDSVPRTWTAEQLSVLEDLAAAAMTEIELRTAMRTLKASEERLRQQAMRDPLTGLFNRRGFSDVARQHLALAHRSQQPFSVAVIDLDAFKQINDRFGHEVGDEALRDMASELSATARESDIVARMGGDEFLVLLAGTDLENARHFVTRLRARLRVRNESGLRDYRLAISSGISSWAPDQPLSLTHLLHHADMAMYTDKRNRRRPAA